MSILAPGAVVDRVAVGPLIGRAISTSVGSFEVGSSGSTGRWATASRRTWETDSLTPVRSAMRPTSAGTLIRVLFASITSSTSAVTLCAAFGPRLAGTTAAIPSATSLRARRPTVLQWQPKASPIATSEANSARDSIAIHADSAARSPNSYT